MTTMLEQLEMMREKMRQMSESELQMVRGLGEALNVADERLREQVRQFAVEHNERRTVALAELRALSARLGALPKGRYDAVRQTALPADPQRYDAAPGGYQQAPRYEPQPQRYEAPQQRYEPPQQPYQAQPQRYEQAPPQQQLPPGGAPGAAATGDWRRAASRIEEEISHFQNMQRARR